MFKKLITERLYLTVMCEDDHDFIRELVNTKGWIQFIGDRKIHSKEDAVLYINKINTTPHFYYLVVHLKNTNEPIGIISFIKRDFLEHFDIGFAFLPQHNGKGYAYEAAKEVLNFVSSKPEHGVVMATTLSENVSSIKLLTRLGFHFDKQIEAGGEKLKLYSNNVK